MGEVGSKEGRREKVKDEGRRGRMGGEKGEMGSETEKRDGKERGG